MDTTRIGGIAGTAVILLAEVALQLSGIESPRLAAFIAVLAIVPLAIVMKPSLWTDQVQRLRAFRARGKPQRELHAVPPKVVKVSVPELIARRYKTSTGTVDVVEVINHTDYRQFRAEVELLYGCQQEVPVLGSQNVYPLAWESNRKPALWLKQGDRGQLLVGEWRTDKEKGQVFLLYRSFAAVEDPSTLSIVNDERTSLTDTNGKLFLKVKVFTEPELPQGVIERTYELSWSGGLKPQGPSTP